MATYGAKLAARNALNGDDLVYDKAAMPAVVFTDPQAASLGLTEMQSRQARHDVKTGILSLDNVPRALAARDTRGLIKLAADAPTHRRTDCSVHTFWHPRAQTAFRLPRSQSATA